MPPKRPAPLSDNLFPDGNPAAAASNVAVAANAMPMYDGMPLQVKNTFIDVPSGLTPSNMKDAANARSHANMTAPPDMNRPSGFLQRAMVASMAPGSSMSQIKETPVCTPMATPTPNAYGGRRVIIHSGHTPMATPSPMAQSAFSHWSSSTILPGNRVAGAFNGAPAGFGASAPGVTLTSMPTGPLTYTLSPTSAARYAGLQSAVGPTSPRAVQGVQQMQPPTMMCGGQTIQYRTVVAPTSNLEEIGDNEGGEEDEDDDSDDGTVPQHLRNPEDAPKPPPGAIHPSEGSEAHDAGACKRCCFFPRGRCNNGYNCVFCHYEHEKRKRKNKKKKKKDGASGAAPSTTTTITTSITTADGRVLHVMPAQAPTYDGMPHNTQLLAPPEGHALIYQAMTAPAADDRQLAPPPQMTYTHGYAPPQHLPPFQQPPPPPQVGGQPWDAAPLSMGPAPGHIIYGPTQVRDAPAPLTTFTAMPPVEAPSAGYTVVQSAPGVGGALGQVVQGGMPPQMHTYMMQPGQVPPPPMYAAHPGVQQQQGSPSQASFAAPPTQAPMMYQQAADNAPPPPMQSPKFRQVVVGSSMAGPPPTAPPPMQSPRLPRTIMQPVVQQTGSPVRMMVPAVPTTAPTALE